MAGLLGHQRKEDQAQVAWTEDASAAATSAPESTATAIEMRAVGIALIAPAALSTAPTPHRPAVGVIATVVATVSVSEHGRSLIEWM